MSTLMTLMASELFGSTNFLVFHSQMSQGLICVIVASLGNCDVILTSARWDCNTSPAEALLAGGVLWPHPSCILLV